MLATFAEGSGNLKPRSDEGSELDYASVILTKAGAISGVVPVWLAGSMRSQRRPRRRPSKARPPGAARTDLFMDWAKPEGGEGGSKGIGYIGGSMREAMKAPLEEIKRKFPPPRRLFIEGIPRVHMDQLVDARYEVYYCSTWSLPEIRRSMSERPSLDLRPPLERSYAHKRDDVTSNVKSDKSDPRSLRDFAQLIRWYRAQRTEPYVIEALRRLGNRELMATLSSQVSNNARSATYRDATFLRVRAEEIDLGLDAAQKELLRYCRMIELHSFHKRLYGVGCLTMLTALSKRPWAYGSRAWRRLNGCTDSARYPQIVTQHSLKTDSRLKSLLYGALPLLIGQGSPYRQFYLERKVSLPVTMKRGHVGRGLYRVTPHAKAVNRVMTKVIDEIRRSCRAWYEAFGKNFRLEKG